MALQIPDWLQKTNAGIAETNLNYFPDFLARLGIPANGFGRYHLYNAEIAKKIPGWTGSQNDLAEVLEYDGYSQQDIEGFFDRSSDRNDASLTNFGISVAGVFAVGATAGALGATGTGAAASGTTAATTGAATTGTATAATTGTATGATAATSLLGNVATDTLVQTGLSLLGNGAQLYAADQNRDFLIEQGNELYARQQALFEAAGGGGSDSPTPTSGNFWAQGTIPSGTFTEGEGPGEGAVAGGFDALSFISSPVELNPDEFLRDPFVDFDQYLRDASELINEPDEVEFNDVSATEAAREALKFTTGTAIPSLIPAAAAITKGIQESARRGVEANAPGFFDRIEQAQANIADRQSGRLSQGSRLAISRQVLSSGAAGLGAGAVAGAFTSAIGQTAEGVASQGDREAQALLTTLRSQFRVVGADQLLPYGGLSTGQAIQTAYQNSLGNLRADEFNVSTQLQADNIRANLRWQYDQARNNSAFRNSENRFQYDAARLSAFQAERNLQYEHGFRISDVYEGIRQFDLTFNEGSRRYNSTFNESQRQYDLTLQEQFRQFNENLSEQDRQFSVNFFEGVRQFDARQDLANLELELGALDSVYGTNAAATNGFNSATQSFIANTTRDAIGVYSNSNNSTVPALSSSSDIYGNSNYSYGQNPYFTTGTGQTVNSQTGQVVPVAQVAGQPTSGYFGGTPSNTY